MDHERYRHFRYREDQRAIVVGHVTSWVVAPAVRRSYVRYWRIPLKNSAADRCLPSVAFLMD
jgi:hypothetical protein